MEPSDSQTLSFEGVETSGAASRALESVAQQNDLGQQATVPLFVDLDGTLIRTDSLWESLLVFIRNMPLQIPLLFLMLFRGKSAFKSFLADNVRLDPETLPYQSDLLEYLAAERAEGRTLVLATAADRRIAEPIAAYLGLFDDVLATDGHVNLAAANKLSAIRQRVGEREFDYAGNSKADVVVFEAARRSIVVSPSRGVQAAAHATGRLKHVFPQNPRSQWPHIARALRPHQWAKNVLVAVPLLTSHNLHDVGAVIEVLTAFVAFCCVASGQYIANDLLDLDADRRHSRKQNRPFADGSLSIVQGLLLSAGLLITGALLAVFALMPEAAVCLGIYAILSFAYSLEFKKHVVVDVLILAALFTIRVFAGGEAIEVNVSQWLLTYSMFLFTSLAFLKRYVEATADDQKNSGFFGRGYRIQDAPFLFVAGLMNGYISVVVFVLYSSSSQVELHYSQPQLLLLACPLLAGWITRVWLLAHRHELHHDPVVFALSDRLSLLTGLVLLNIIYSAM